MQKILVIDDDRELCLLLKQFLQTSGYTVLLAHSGKQALECLEHTEFQLVLADLRLINNNGNETLLRIREMCPNMPIIILAGYSEIRMAVEILKLGALDYITKPIVPEEIILAIQNAIKKDHKGPRKSHSADNTVRVPPVSFSDEIFPNSPLVHEMLEQVNQIAPTDYNVLIYGESGSGKEVIAREIHKRSRRNIKPFVVLHCGSLTKELAAGELFGYEKGHSAKGLHPRAGILESANGGVLFLNEITKLSTEVQTMLLRVITEKKLRRAGSTKEVILDIRFITASNERMLDGAAKGKIAEDLYHRLNEFSIIVPSLRERSEELVVFACHFLKLSNEETGKDIKGFSPEVLDIFKNYIWYGNLRELKNVVSRSAMLTDGEYIEDRALPFEISNFKKLLLERTPVEPVGLRFTQTQPVPAGPRIVLHENTLKEVSIDAEYEMIVEALKHTNYNKSKAARFLNIDRKTLYNKMKQYQQLNNQ